MSPLGNFLKESHLLSDSEEITAPKSPSSELQCLSSLLLKMGNDPSVNLIEILEFGPKFLCCNASITSITPPRTISRFVIKIVSTSP